MIFFLHLFFYLGFWMYGANKVIKEPRKHYSLVFPIFIKDIVNFKKFNGNEMNFDHNKISGKEKIVFLICN
jgi:hypothetical protein